MGDQNQISVHVAGDVDGELIVAGGNVTVDRRTIYVGQPPSAAERTDARNRLVLLEKVSQFWVQGVLEKSLHGMARIELGLEERPESVEHPWEMVLQTLDGQPQRIEPGTSMIDLFDSMTQAMLILGEPGSGKTTMLLDLTRSLIARTRDNVDSPIPVVFTLSAWAAKRLPLVDWLVDELNAKYLVPRETGREWLKQQSLGLLLDGLDEVRLDLRDDCVAAINGFRSEYGLTPICVSSRTTEYEMLSTPLNVEGAVVVGAQKPVPGKDGKRIQLKLEGALLLKPLTDQQIAEYIGRAGAELAGLHSLMQKDASLRELAHSPLMLSIMMVAYRGRPEDQIAAGSVEDHRKHLFDAYIERMFKRRLGKSAYTPEETTKRLSWLAQKMQQSGQTMLLMENMQPSWLETAGQRRAYVWLQRLVGFPLLVLPFVLVGAMGFFGAMIPFYSLDSLAATPGLLILPIVAALLIGLVAAVIVSATASKKADQPIQVIESLRWSPGWSWQAALAGLLTPLLGSVLIGVLWTAGIYAREPFGLHIALFRLGAALLPGMVLGLLCGLLAAGVFGLLFGGMKSSIVSTSIRPNAGIRLSLRNALVMGLGAAAAISILAFVIQQVALQTRLVRNFDMIAQFLWGLFAVVTVGMATGYLISVQYGGGAVVQHYTLRWVLARSAAQPAAAQQKVLPFKLVPFLDEAANLILMRKVGGGYLFVHRLLMEHFAADSVPAAAEAPPSLPHPLLRFVRPALILATLVGMLALAWQGQDIWAALALVLLLALSGVYERFNDRRMLIGGLAVVGAAMVFLAVWAVAFDGRDWMRRYQSNGTIDSVRWRDSETIIAATFGNAQLIDAASGTMREGAVFDSYASESHISPDGSRLVRINNVYDEPAMQVNDLETGETLFEIEGGYLMLPAWSPESRLIVGQMVYPALGEVSDALTILDAETGERVRELPLEDVYVVGIAWSPDGAQIALTLGSDSIRLIAINPVTGEVITEFSGGDGIDQDSVPVWSANGTRLAMISRGNRRDVQVWDAATGALQQTLSLPEWVSAIAFSPDGQRLTVGVVSGEVLIFDIDSGQIVDRRLGHTTSVGLLEWSPDGTRLLSVDYLGYQIWEMGE